MFDVAVVGAGAGGAPAAYNLARKGYKVVVIEMGQYFPDAPLPIEKGGEIEKFTKYQSNPNNRHEAKDIFPVIDCSHSEINIHNYYGVGGSTLLYSCMYPRLHETDFSLFTNEGIARDWPIKEKDLRRYYQQDVEITGVSGAAGDPVNPNYIPNLPPVPMGKMGNKLIKALESKNWHYWPAFASLNTIGYNDRAKDDYTRPSNLGPAGNSKGSVNNTYLKYASDHGATIISGTRVKKILLNKDSSVYALQSVNTKGDCSLIKAKVYILSCGGILTPHLLQASRSEDFKHGVGNQNDLVGKNLMLHPWGYVEGQHNELLNSNFGPQGCCISSQEFYFSKPERDFKRGYLMQFIRSGLAAEQAIAAYRQKKLKPGKSFIDNFRNLYNKTMQGVIICDDFPVDTNKVAVNWKVLDKLGCPSININYRLSSNTKQQLGHGITSLKSVLKEAGCKKIVGYGPLVETGWHTLGTCSMGNNPNESTVNKYGQCHFHKNLYISDGSVFATGGAVNPCATIQAISLFISDNIHKHWEANAF